MAKNALGPRPALKRGQRVSIHEEGIRPWLGTVMNLKPSSVSGWWVEVRDDDGGTWGLCLATGVMIEPRPAGSHLVEDRRRVGA